MRGSQGSKDPATPRLQPGLKLSVVAPPAHGRAALPTRQLMNWTDGLPARDSRNDVGAIFEAPTEYPMSGSDLLHKPACSGCRSAYGLRARRWSTCALARGTRSPQDYEWLCRHRICMRPRNVLYSAESDVGQRCGPRRSPVRSPWRKPGQRSDCRP